MSKAGDGDKRSVATDALDTLGSIISANEKRDAIHLAVEPVVAQMKLYPGQDVGPDGTTLTDPVGIVDPFLKAPVMPGERFWLVIYPRMIHSLRHVWTHPAFEDEPEFQPMAGPTKGESELWLRSFCENHDTPGYEAVMAAISDQPLPQIDDAYGKYGNSYSNDGEYLFFLGRDAHADIPPEFWVHAQNVLGDKLNKLRPTAFSCSC